MSHSSDRAQRGYMLMEVAVALLALVLILVLSAQLLFATRRASVRQQLHVEARQVARGAADYLAFQARGATDLVTDAIGGVNGPQPTRRRSRGRARATLDRRPSPDCGVRGRIPMQAEVVQQRVRRHPGRRRHRHHHDRANRPVVRIGAASVAGRGSPPGREIYWRFDLGCPPTATGWGDNHAANLDFFKAYTGYHTTRLPGRQPRLQ